MRQMETPCQDTPFVINKMVGERCHPECRWACDDPQCNAECKIVTEPPVCTCANPTVQPVCRVDCPLDQCESEQCPACQTICEQSEACGAILCQETRASWACRKPSCPYPTCELQCEQPACEYSGTEDVWKKTKFPWWIVIVVCIVLYIRSVQLTSVR